jgi:hypothetical protein
MDAGHLEEISQEIQTLHKSMKNVIEIVFAISPLMALSTRGWASKNYHSTFLLRVSDVEVVLRQSLTDDKIFVALGNDRPQILVQLEDCVLEAIVAISEGKPRENAMQNLYSNLTGLEKALIDDKDALTWFNLSKDDIVSPSTLPPSTLRPSTPPAGSSVLNFQSFV